MLHKPSARLGNRNTFSVARDQMLVAWGGRAPLKHSLVFDVVSITNYLTEQF